VTKLLAISPHLDDAVLSYGGQLAQLAAVGHQVTVYTVFAGTPDPPYSPLAAYFHELWELTGDPLAPRRDEDRRALSVLGATPVHGHHLDALYRRDERGAWLLDDVSPMEYCGEEPGLVADIASVLEKLIGRYAPDQVATCAAIGNHVDHRRARDATMLAAVRAGVPLVLWEDFPYATWTRDVPPPPVPLAVPAAVAEPVGGPAWAKKSRAIQCYQSQLAMLEGDGIPLTELWLRHCARHADEFGAEGCYEIVRPMAALGTGAAFRGTSNAGRSG
jgi:LmbE family N-acetylglucosaminyl deacetylase